MKFLHFAFWFVFYNAAVVLTKHRSVLTIDENSVCHIKQTCLKCLRLPQCSWCSVERKCYSEKLLKHQGYCKNDTVQHTDYGLSLEENAECSCANGEMERNCVQPGSAQEEECSGRGKCICGRCLCDLHPDLDHPTKTVIGEYCEFDNFSCDGPKCNEGPYSINDQKINEEEYVEAKTDVAQPLEE